MQTVSRRQFAWNVKTIFWENKKHIIYGFMILDYGFGTMTATTSMCNARYQLESSRFTVSMLGKISAADILKYFFLFFPQK